MNSSRALFPARFRLARPFTLALAFALLGAPLPGCGGEGGEGDEGAGDKSGTGDKGASEGGAGAKDEGASAAGDAIAAAETVSDCPKSLGGRETGKNRILKKECGTITVTEDYYVDAGSLTIEGGVTLAFQNGKALHVAYYDPAKLIVKGSAAEPATLTSAGDKVAGAWMGVRIHPKGVRSSIDGLVVEHAGTETEGALYVEAPDVTVKNSTIRETKGAGLLALGEIDLAEMSGNTFEKNGKNVAMEMDARPSGSIGAGHKLATDARIVVRGGKLKNGGKWPAQSAPYFAMGELYVEGDPASPATFEIEPGAEVRFDTGKNLMVGYHGPGALKAVGTAEKPIVLTSVARKGAGDWGGVVIYAGGEATLEHVTFEFGGAGDRGALELSNGERGDTTVKACTFKSSTIGIRTIEEKAKLAAVSGTSFAGTPVALSVFPSHVAALAADNVLEKGARLVVQSGTLLGGAMSWHPPAVLELAGELYVEKGSVLTIEAGAEIAVGSGKGIHVGYHDEGTLKILGTTEKPVTIRALDKDEPGVWKNVAFHEHARGSVMEHVKIRGAGEGSAPAVDAAAGSEVTLMDVTGEKLGAGILGWECKAKVTLDGKPPAAKCR